MKPASLKARALQALALREQSRAELRTKLLRWQSRRAAAAALQADPAEQADDAAATAAAVDALLDELEARGLLSAQRFVESRVHARAGRFGNRRIQAELAQHGLALDDELAGQLRSSELERAQAVWVRRFGAAHDPAAPADPQEQARQMRFLAARGFSAEVVRKVVRGGRSD